MSKETKIIAVLGLLAFCSTGLADELLVPAEYPTIQAAIEAARDYDTVLVVDGTYTGPGNRDIDFFGKAITVRSESGPENCIIDCQNSGRGFYFYKGEDANVILDGFTITNGYTRSYGSRGGGGGIYCDNSSPTITNCTITDNTGYGLGGGGIYCEQSNPTITNCKISGNSIYARSQGGGGIYCYRSNPKISNCTITGNTGDEKGGGIYCKGSSPTITNCTIIGNSAMRYGGGIYCDESSPTITNCAISNNTARWGGGIHCWDGNLTITNCIFWNNFWNNEAAEDSAEIVLRRFSHASVSYTDVQDGQDGVYVDPGCTLNWDEGNINVDPCFVEIGAGYWDDNGTPDNARDDLWVWADGDYHLLPDSHCIDAGTDANVYTDIEGNIRPFDFPGVDNNGELPEFDMGAYELVLIEAEMKFTPQTLNCRSKGNLVKAHLTLPEGFLPQDVDVNAPAMAEPMGIESEYIKVLGAGTGPVRLEICFDRQAFCEAVTGADDSSLEVTVIGSLITSRYFYATDTIRIKP